MKTLLYVIAASACAWATLMLFLRAMARVLRKGALEAAHAALRHEEVIMMTDNAVYTGADFPGPNLPPRTSGVLAVTDRRVFFMPLYPRRSISLPHGWITDISLDSANSPIPAPIPTLIMRVRDLKDPEGIIGWLVHEPGAWLEALLSAREGYGEAKNRMPKKQGKSTVE